MKKKIYQKEAWFWTCFLIIFILIHLIRLINFPHDVNSFSACVRPGYAGFQEFAVHNQACILVCLSIAKGVNPKYQTDTPVIPCLCNDLFKLTKQLLLERFINSGTIKQLTTTIKLFKDNFAWNFIKPTITNMLQQSMLGVVAEQQLKHLNLNRKYPIWVWHSYV